MFGSVCPYLAGIVHSAELLANRCRVVSVIVAVAQIAIAMVFVSIIIGLVGELAQVGDWRPCNRSERSCEESS
jgi:hypothetical protein